MTGRQYRASVIRGSRMALANALKITPPADLKAATSELLKRLGSEGRVEDDVLGWAPDDWGAGPAGDSYWRGRPRLRRPTSINRVSGKSAVVANKRTIHHGNRTAGDWPAAGACNGGQPARTQDIRMGIIMRLGKSTAARPPRKAADGTTSRRTVDRIVAVGFGLGRADTSAGDLGRRITRPRGRRGVGLRTPHGLLM